MQLAHQPSMWDLAEEAALTQLPGRVVRHQLSRGAWVDHLPGWVTGSESVLEVLLGDIGWRADRRQMYEREVAVPRLLRWYPGHEQLPHPLLTEARESLNRHYAAELGAAPVLLVDDLADSRWTLTVAGRELRRAGAVAVLPFALALTA